jgi:hypothetical protein
MQRFRNRPISPPDPNPALGSPPFPAGPQGPTPPPPVPAAGGWWTSNAVPPSPKKKENSKSVHPGGWGAHPKKKRRRKGDQGPSPARWHPCRVPRYTTYWWLLARGVCTYPRWVSPVDRGITVSCWVSGSEGADFEGYRISPKMDDMGIAGCPFSGSSRIWWSHLCTMPDQAEISKILAEPRRSKIRPPPFRTVRLVSTPTFRGDREIWPRHRSIPTVVCTTPETVFGARGGGGRRTLSDRDGSSHVWTQFLRRIQIWIGELKILTVAPDLATSNISCRATSFRTA